MDNDSKSSKQLRSIQHDHQRRSEFSSPRNLSFNLEKRVDFRLTIGRFSSLKRWCLVH